jgi:hypothetical protein
MVILELPKPISDQYNQDRVNTWYGDIKTPQELLTKVCASMPFRTCLTMPALSPSCSRPIFILENREAVTCGRDPYSLKYILSGKDKEEPLEELQKCDWKPHKSTGVSADVQKALWRDKAVIRKEFYTDLRWDEGGPVEEALAVRLDITRRLSGLPHCCTYLAYDRDTRSLYTSDCGIQVTERTLPKDWEKQLDDLFRILFSKGIVINDFKIENLLVKDGQLYLVDYGADVMLGVHTRTSSYLRSRESCTLTKAKAYLTGVLGLA